MMDLLRFLQNISSVLHQESKETCEFTQFFFIPVTVIPVTKPEVAGMIL